MKPKPKTGPINCNELRKERDALRLAYGLLSDTIDAMRAADETNCETMAENERLRSELAALQKKIHDGKIWNTENPRWTPRTGSAPALAAKEAEAQGATYVDTSHVLLGLLKQQEGIAHRIFLAAGLTYDATAFALRVGRFS